MNITDLKSNYTCNFPKPPEGVTAPGNFENFIKERAEIEAKRDLPDPRELKRFRAVRVICVSAVIIGIAILIINATCGIKNFPKSFTDAFTQKLPSWKIAVITSASIATFGIVGAISYKATRGKDPIFKYLEMQEGFQETVKKHDITPVNHRGSFLKTDACIPIALDTLYVRKSSVDLPTYTSKDIDDYLQEENLEFKNLYKNNLEELNFKLKWFKNSNLLNSQNLDVSTLDENGTGVAFAYFHKPCAEIDLIALNIIFSTATHPLFIAYNVVRAVVAPLYILGCKIRDCFKTPLKMDKKQFRWIDIPLECGRSLYRAIRIPFYSIAIIFSCIYTWMNPIAGRKLISSVEREFNRGVPRHRSVWVFAPQSNFVFEGGGAPDSIGNMGHYFAGCMQPASMIFYKDGKIVDAQAMHSHYHMRIYDHSYFKSHNT